MSSGIHASSPLEQPTIILSQYIAQATYEGIPSDVVLTAKNYILDSLANIIGGSSLEAGRIVISLIEEMGGVPEATILATGRKVPTLHAVYVNSYLANALDFDDTFSAFAHPGSTAVPPALAVGEKVRASGKDLINAVVVAYEVMIRIGKAIKGSPERFKKVWGLSTWQIFGAVAAAATLLGLDQEKTANALGLAGVNAPVPYARKLGLELEERPFAWSKNNYGWASMGGVLGAFLAEKGFLGNRFILDGERGFWIMSGSDQCKWELMTEGLGTNYVMGETAFKPYASCRWTHSTIDAVSGIKEKFHFAPEEVKGIKVQSFYEAMISLAEPTPQNIIDVQFSIPHLVALVLLDRSPAKGLSEANLSDPKLQQLARKIQIEIDDEASRLFFEQGEMPSTVVIELNDGRIFIESVPVAKGDARNPMTEKEIKDKFMSLVAPVLGADRAERIKERVDNLERLEELSQLLN